MKTISYLFLILLCSCAPALYKPLPEHTSSNTTHEQLMSGRTSYINKCGSCHSLYLPQQYKTEVWERNLNEMQERANISDTEKKLILLYLTSYPVTSKK